MSVQNASIPYPALTLGLGGLLPFFTAAIAVCYLAGTEPSEAASRNFALRALGGYGAVILSFLGGIRWGNLLHDNSQADRWGPLTWSVVPSLVAWTALLLAPGAMLMLLFIGFGCQYLLDRAAVSRQELPAWFGRLRLMLTTGAMASVLIAWLAVNLAD